MLFEYKMPDITGYLWSLSLRRAIILDRLRIQVAPQLRRQADASLSGSTPVGPLAGDALFCHVSSV
jgi:hypothetical protein